MHINYYLDSKVNKHGESGLYVYLRYGKPLKTIKVSTSHRIAPKHWDSIKQKVKKSLAESPEINEYLNQAKTNINKELEALMAGKTSVDIPDIQTAILKGLGKDFSDEKEVDFFKIFDLFMQYQENIVKSAVGTIKKYRTTRNYLHKYQSDKRLKITFDIIDISFYQQFKAWLQSRPNTNANRITTIGRVNDTISKHIGVLKTFLSWAEKNKYHSNQTYKEFEAKKSVKVDNVVLTPEEIRKIEQLDLTDNPHIDRIRDLVVFGIYTAQRWSDIEAFKPDDIQNGIWQFTSQKSKKEIAIPLNEGFCSPARVVLEKYDYQLPKVTNQHFNRSVKVLCQLAGIDDSVKLKRKQENKIIDITGSKYEFLTSHSLRRTAITFLIQRIPIPLLMKLTGHSDIKTLMKYENLSQAELFNALQGLTI
jgi:integrase